MDKKLHPSVESLLKHFEYQHLSPKLQAVSRPICEMAHRLAAELDGPECAAGLRKLLEAKDCFVRAAIG